MFQKINSCCHLQIEEINSSITVPKRSKLQKKYYFEKKKSLATGDIILVDLTKEDDHELSEKNFKRKEKLKWLKSVEKKRISNSMSVIQDSDFENNAEYHRKMADILISNVPKIDNRVTESSKLEVLPTSHKNCDGIKYNENSILSYSNDIHINDDFTVNKKTGEPNRNGSILSEFFNDNICDMSIDINLLHEESEKFSFLNESFNDSSLNIIEAVDSCVIQKNYEENSLTKTDVPFNNFQKDSLFMNCEDKKHQLLIDVSDFGLLESGEKTSSIFEKESSITSTEVSSSLFIFKKNSEIELDEFSKTTFFDDHFISDHKEDSILLPDVKDLKKETFENNGKKTFDVKDKYDSNNVMLPQKNEKIQSENKILASLKITENSAVKMRKQIQPEDESFFLLNHKRKFEGRLEILKTQTIFKVLGFSMIFFSNINFIFDLKHK